MIPAILVADNELIHFNADAVAVLVFAGFRGKADPLFCQKKDSIRMATFVLVHGAWHGGWCWAQTEDALQRMGHRCFSPTLTGLGDRSHLLRPGLTPDDHVDDIVNFIAWRDLQDVILVGHSYGGMVTTGVASRIPESFAALIYLDAFVPEKSGVSLFANANPARMARFQQQIDAGAIAVEPDMFESWTDDPDNDVWLRDKCTPHPVETFRQGATLTGRQNEVARKHYILCSRNSPSAFEAEYEKVDGLPGWSRNSIDTMHDAMVDAPDVLARMIAGIAENM